MIFVMDESGSITSERFELMRQFAITLTNEFEIAPDRTRVGWINFDEQASVIFNLNTYQNKETLHIAIRAVPYNGGGTNIGAGLQALHDYGFVESAGARNTFDIPEVAIVVTDGESSLVDIEAAAELLRNNRNINVFAVGVGDGVSIPQLNAVVSAGIADKLTQLSHVHHLDTFSEQGFDALQETIRARTCFGKFFQISLP